MIIGLLAAVAAHMMVLTVTILKRVFLPIAELPIFVFNPTHKRDNSHAFCINNELQRYNIFLAQRIISNVKNKLGKKRQKHISL